MASSSALLRRIPRNRFTGFSSYSIFGSGSCQMSTASEVRVRKTAPWLMLPPAAYKSVGTTNTLSFQFYSLAWKKVVTLYGGTVKELQLEEELMPNPVRNFMFRGSSLGWLALLNRHNLDLFLFNPVSRRHVKLPPIRELPNFPKNSPRDVTKVILSSSPDEDEENCRAVIIYNCVESMAFCCPGKSDHWTPIGEVRWWEREARILSRGYRDCVYSAREKLFFCLTNFGELEAWDLRDTSSPRLIKMKVDDCEYYDSFDKYKCLNLKELQTKELCRPVKHLVVVAAEEQEQDHLLLVTQYVMEHASPNGSYVDCLDVGSRKCPYITVDFDVDKYDPVKEGYLLRTSSLDGLALFVGYHSHSVALPANHKFPYVKPNSIYFTDGVRKETLSNDDDYDGSFGGHDIGIFDCKRKIVSSCYYPCDVQSLKRIMPPPMWFFPTLPC